MLGGFFKTSKSRTFSAGGSIASELQAKLANFQGDLGKLNKRLLSDITTRAPSPISAAVSKTYAVGKLAAVKRTNFLGGGKRALTKRGNTIVLARKDGDDYSVEFSGHVFSDWPTFANNRKVVPKFVKVRGNRKKGTKTKRVRKPYTVSREVIRGKRVAIEPTDEKNRIFVLGGKGELKPFIVTPSNNYPRVFGATSIPQAIMRPDTVKAWQPEVESLIRKRLDHHLNQLSKRKY